MRANCPILADRGGTVSIMPVADPIERLHEEFPRRIRTRTVLSSPETATMVFWALLTSGRVMMRTGDGWPTLAAPPTDDIVDLAA